MAIVSGAAVMSPNSAIVVGIFAGTIAAWVLRNAKANWIDNVRRLAFLQLLTAALGLVAAAVFGVSAIGSRTSGEPSFAGLLETGQSASLITQFVGILVASTWALLGSYAACFIAKWPTRESQRHTDRCLRV
jgi:ammonia channel protein AmtB